MIRTALIDDEADALDVLQALLAREFPEVEIVGTFQSSTEALRELPKLSVELLFLDIQMPGITGLELLDVFGALDLHCVFVTAHAKYAIQALRLEALDYLLKPIDPDEFVQVVHRVRQRLLRNVAPAPLPTDLKHVGGMVRIPTGKGWKVLPKNEVIYLRAQGNYCEVHQVGGTVTTVIQLLKDFEAQLTPKGFLRVHQSYLVNRAHLREFVRSYGGSLLLSDGSEIPVSKKYRMAVEQAFS